MIDKQEMIDAATKRLKQEGFLKKHYRWTKDIGDFTLVFLIQGSIYDKTYYYIRPGVFINGLEYASYYGHFFCEINSTTCEEVFVTFQAFCSTWTDKKKIKETTLAFLEWDKRNPLEKRRAMQVDYLADPVPSDVLYSVSRFVIDTIVSSF